MITGFMLNDKICCNLQKMSLPIGIEGFELLNLWISQLYAHVNKTILTKKMGPKIVLIAIGASLYYRKRIHLYVIYWTNQCSRR